MTLYGLNSEYAALTAVLLYKPTASIASHPFPKAIQHISQIGHNELTEELNRLIETFQSRGVSVKLIDPPQDPTDSSNYNMMFCRDLAFMTPEGAILASMANETRRGEVSHAAAAFAATGIPVIHTINGKGQFEGADALWINRKLVAIGVGNRTNFEAFEQIKTLLEMQGVKAVPLSSTQNRTQHLLGSLQIVDKDLALVREEIISTGVIDFLEEHDFSIVKIPENTEVTTRQAMNIVTVAQRQIIMTADCPETMQIYRSAGIEIVAELPISQLINGAGGLACATGILARTAI